MSNIFQTGPNGELPDEADIHVRDIIRNIETGEVYEVTSVDAQRAVLKPLDQPDDKQAP